MLLGEYLFIFSSFMTFHNGRIIELWSDFIMDFRPHFSHDLSNLFLELLGHKQSIEDTNYSILLLIFIYDRQTKPIYTHHILVDFDP